MIERKKGGHDRDYHPQTIRLGIKKRGSREIEEFRRGAKKFS